MFFLNQNGGFMLKKLFLLLFISLMTISNFVSADTDYQIHDIDTLQTRSSQAIALNNKGQILGWYNIDNSDAGKHFFVRDKDRVFYELLCKEPTSGLDINWQFLTDEGKAYGTCDVNASTKSLCAWDSKNGIVKLGNLPGKEISAINNAGQILIKSVVENENGKSIQRPVIWQNGQITKLKGLGIDLGTESEESYGYSINNKGEVVGQSLVSLSYKNQFYKKVHAVKWINGQPIDLHTKVPKTEASYAIAINDLGDLLIKSEKNYLFYVDANGTCRQDAMAINKMNNLGYIYYEDQIVDKKANYILRNRSFNQKIQEDINSIWLSLIKIVSINDHGEIIAQGRTIYGEEHAMLLTPAKSK